MKQKTKKRQAVLSITAFIDLLGFSSHLELASFDLRTEVGESAHSRLQIIESAIELFEAEKAKYPAIYPVTLRYQRFNDALILGIDVEDIIVPKIGDPNVTYGTSYNKLKKLADRDGTEDMTKTYSKYFGIESIKVGLFLGLVSRLHMYINQQELEINMPGCRTIVSSGLRFRFYDRKGNEDYNSANFSFTNAFIVNEAGSKKGFAGNNLYLDDNVAQICGFSEYTKRLLAYSKFIPLRSPNDPYSGITILRLLRETTEYAITERIPIDLFGKRFTFRALNTTPISNFQLLPHLIELIKVNKHKSDSIIQKMIDGIMEDSPTLKDVNNVKETINVFNWPTYIFLNLRYSLLEDFKKTVEVLKKGKPQ